MRDGTKIALGRGVAVGYRFVVRGVARGFLAASIGVGGCYQGFDRGSGAVDESGGPLTGGSSDSEGDAESGGEETAECVPGWVGVQRLNRREYANTLRDLLGVDPSVADSLPLDPRKGGFDNNASVLGITPEIYERYLNIAEQAVPEALEADRARFIGCEPATESFDDPCVSDTLLAFAERAYRRPLADAEIDDLRALHDAAVEDTETFDETVTLVFEGLLVSPAFLYRNAVPTDEDAEVPVKLDGYALASRMSYFLWSSMPDDALMQAARDGDLEDPQALRAQVRRMLLDEKANELVTHFTRSWLDIEPLASKVFDPVAFPTVDATLLARMQDETVALTRHVIAEDLPVRELLEADYSFIDGALASHYGIAGVEGTELVMTPVPSDQRRGILTHASVLAATAHPDRTSIPARGMWVMDNLLCLPPPPPPPPDVDVGEFDEDPEAPTTQRERLDQHRTDPTCAGCHTLMDNLGFGLENYDAVGLYRELENGLEVDASGKLPSGDAFEGALELSGLLVDEPDFAMCVATNLLGYGLGRLPTDDDECTFDALEEASLASPDASFVDIVVDLMQSDAFRFQDAREAVE